MNRLLFRCLDATSSPTSQQLLVTPKYEQRLLPLGLIVCGLWGCYFYLWWLAVAGFCQVEETRTECKRCTQFVVMDLGYQAVDCFWSCSLCSVLGCRVGPPTRGCFYLDVVCTAPFLLFGRGFAPCQRPQGHLVSADPPPPPPSRMDAITPIRPQRQRVGEVGGQTTPHCSPHPDMQR